MRPIRVLSRSFIGIRVTRETSSPCQPVALVDQREGSRAGPLLIMLRVNSRCSRLLSPSRCGIRRCQIRLHGSLSQLPFSSLCSSTTRLRSPRPPLPSRPLPRSRSRLRVRSLRRRTILRPSRQRSRPIRPPSKDSGSWRCNRNSNAKLSRNRPPRS